jgi:hypothetical protein
LADFQTGSQSSCSLDWLKWTGQDLERHIAESDTVAAIIGINKMGDLQTIFSPIIIPNAFNNGKYSAIIGNSSNKYTEPSFVYTDASDIGSIMIIMTYKISPLSYVQENPSHQGSLLIPLGPVPR